tara:strand:+ start:1324 stop:1683 length:360 start_codon:yes stop_codon:yes gene_type:complete
MSLFKTYSPRTLYLSTLKLTNALFRRAPKVETPSDNYLKHVLQLHDEIRKDMTAMFDSDPGGNVSTDPIYTEKIYESLCNLETILLGGKSKWPKTIEGCEKYTADIIKQLQKSEACLIS